MNRNGLLVLAVFSVVFSRNSAAETINLAESPLYIGSDVLPSVMLAVSRDHQLFYKAYNDYSDLNNNGTINTTYEHQIDYYGYFDSYKCYEYDTGLALFSPKSISANKYCSGAWSGNFLNWVSMSRMDVLRKLLYGGYRSEDGDSTTILERALLTTDGHAWSKWYAGSDVHQLTPFSESDFPAAPPTVNITTTSSVTIPDTQPSDCSLSFVFPTPTFQIYNGDQLKIAYDDTHYIKGRVCSLSKSSGNTTLKIDFGPKMEGIPTDSRGGSSNKWIITNYSRAGISFCNTTDTGGNGSSETLSTVTYPPLIKVARGNYGLWLGEGKECLWSGSINYNNIAQTGLGANYNSPKKDEMGIGSKDYVARVKVCDPDKIGKEKCKKYPDGTWKPIGLLQAYGDNKQINFGLVTGSYGKNMSGGVLRKNISELTDEIDVDHTGKFLKQSDTDIDPGIIKTLNRIRLYGYSYSDGKYNSGGDNCGSPGLMYSNLSDGKCSSWGNPMSEIYIESLRYLAGKSANTNFTSSLAKDDTLKLPLAQWSDPLNEKNYCSPLSVLMLNASVSSYDNNQVAMADVNGADAVTETTTIGSKEGINGHAFLVGNNGAASPDLMCSAKTVDGLGTTNGICPEAPAQYGSYLSAGAASFAHTNRIRTDIAVPATDKKSLKVDTYGIALATNVPKIKVPVPGKTGQTVTILPAMRCINPNYCGSGQIVEFKVIERDVVKGTGKYFVQWEDSQQGNDYDLDFYGIISYEFKNSGNQIDVTTQVVGGAAGYTLGFGYVISGTDGDGVHFFSAFKGGYVFNYPTDKSECNDCNHKVDGPKTKTFNVTTNSTDVLNDPLWYAAKWGGFKDLNENNKLDLDDLIIDGKNYGTAEWDSKKSDGTAGSDGIPDNYFYVVNPGDLEKSLNKTFTQILESSSAASVATNSTTLRSGSRVYQARFNSKLWSGQLLSFKLDESANVIEPPEWDAGVIINTQSSDSSDNRRIITYSRDSKDGIPFQWSDINGLTDQTQATALNANGAGVADGKGKERLEYLRGWKINEGFSATNFRQRNISILGDIVNSNPWYVGAPQAGFPSKEYLDFRTTNLKRKPVIYVGANDGMLHGFDASTDAVNDLPISDVTGKELIAYVPGKVYPNLSKLTEVNYSHRYFVDGSPMVADADVGGWRTVLVGGLNAGGQGYYALDVTNPANFTTESNADELVMWEFTDEDDPDLGYTFNQPILRDDQSPESGQIMKMANGKWAVIFGNGYNNTEADDNDGCIDDPDVKPCTVSTTGHAALYILFLEGRGTDGKWTAGTDFIKLDTGAGTIAVPNGLATPRPIDSDGDGDVDYIYAGDLQGNLWKFDVSGSATADWKVALDEKPLFTAKDENNNSQPITSAPTVTPHPYGGFMVSFGTGKYLEVNDVDSTVVPFTTQTLYGLWDKPGDEARSIKADRSTLVEQTIIQTTTISGSNYRIASQEEIIWEATATKEAKDGWYMNLPDSKTTGERVVYNPLLRFGRFVATTLIPSKSPCESGGNSWLMEVDYLSGGRRNSSPFDVNQDKKIDSADLQTITVTSPTGQATQISVAVSGTDTGIGITPTATVIKGKGDEFKVLSGSSGKVKTIREEGGDSGRLNWREIIND